MPTPAPQQQNSWVALLFAKFKAIWGQRWTSQFPTAESLDLSRAEWTDAISALSAEELRRGIITCRDTHAWPPSIAEFLTAARQGHEHHTAAYRIVDPARLLPHKRTVTQLTQGKRYLAAILGILHSHGRHGASTP